MKHGILILSSVAALLISAPQCTGQSVTGTWQQKSDSDVYLSAVRSLSRDAVLICISRNSRFAAVADNEEIIIFDLVDGSIAQRLAGHGFSGKHSAAFSADNAYLFTSCFDNVPLDFTGMLETEENDIPQLKALQKVLTLGRKGHQANEHHTVIKWSVNTGEEIDRMPIKQHAKSGGLAISADGQKLAYVMHLHDKTLIRITKLNSSEQVHDIPLGEATFHQSSSIAWSEDARTICACSCNTILIVSAPTGNVPTRITDYSSLMPVSNSLFPYRYHFKQVVAFNGGFIAPFHLFETVVLSNAQLLEEYKRLGNLEATRNMDYIPPEAKVASPFTNKWTTGFAVINTKKKQPTVQKLESREVGTDKHNAYWMSGRAVDGFTETNASGQFVLPVPATESALLCSLSVDGQQATTTVFRKVNDKLAAQGKAVLSAPYSVAELQLVIHNSLTNGQSATDRGFQTGGTSIPASPSAPSNALQNELTVAELLYLSDGRETAVYRRKRQIVVFDLKTQQTVAAVDATDCFPDIVEKSLQSELSRLYRPSIFIDEASSRLLLAEPIYGGITGIYSTESLEKMHQRFPYAFATDTQCTAEEALFCDVISAIPKWRIRSLQISTNDVQTFRAQVSGEQLCVCGFDVSQGWILAVKSRNEVAFLRLEDPRSVDTVRLSAFIYPEPNMDLYGSRSFEETKIFNQVQSLHVFRAGGSGPMNSNTDRRLVSEAFRESIDRTSWQQSSFIGSSRTTSEFEVLSLLPTGNQYSDFPAPEVTTTRLRFLDSASEVQRMNYIKDKGRGIAENMYTQSNGGGSRIVVNPSAGEVTVCSSVVFQMENGAFGEYFGDATWGKYHKIDFFHLASGRYLRTTKIPIAVFDRTLKDLLVGHPVPKEVIPRVASISRLSTSPDGKLVGVACSGSSDVLYICDANTGRLIQEINGVKCGEFLDNGRVLADDRLIDVTSGSIETRLQFGEELAETTRSVRVLEGSEKLEPSTEDIAAPWLWFVGVGANKYAGFDQLVCAERDVTAMADALHEANATRFGKIEKRLFTGANAELHKVKDSLDDLEKATRPGDTVVLMFAGHGVKAIRGLYLALPETKVNELQATALNWTDVATSISHIEASRIVIILDACHSGAFAESNLSIQKELQAKLLSKQGLVIISASGGNEFALEVDSLGQGACTVGFLELLKEAAEIRSSTVRTVGHWKQKLAKRVAELTADQQHPEWSGLTVSDDADLFVEPNTNIQQALSNASMNKSASLDSRIAPELPTLPATGIPEVFIADRDFLLTQNQSGLSASQTQRLRVYRKMTSGSSGVQNLYTLREELRATAPAQFDFYSNAATEELAALAEVDVPEALHQLGYYYLEGRHGLERDPAKCVELCRRGAELNYHPAIHTLGYCLEAGIGAVKDEQAARECFERAAYMGNSCSMAALGKATLTEHSDDRRKVSEAINLIRRSAELGCESGQYDLGKLYLAGTGLTRSVESGIYWMKKSAEKKSVEAMMVLGKLYADGRDVARNPKLAIDYYRKAKAAGNTEAVDRLKELGVQ